MSQGVDPLLEAAIDLLLEALRYIRSFHGKTFVIRCGSDLDGAGLWDLGRDIALLRSVGIRAVVVHPGSAAKTQDPEGPARVHHGLVLAIGPHARAVGLSGSDGAPRCILSAPENHQLRANVELIEHLSADYVTVIEAVGVDASGDTCVVDADEAAARLAVALNADRLLFVAGTGRVSLRDLAGDHQVSEMRATDDIFRRLDLDPAMRNQLDVAVSALAQGVQFAQFLPEHDSHALLLELFTDEGYGTKLWREADWTLDASGLVFRKPMD